MEVGFLGKGGSTSRGKGNGKKRSPTDAKGPEKGQKGKGGDGGGMRFEGNCRKCGERGHTRKHCWSAAVKEVGGVDHPEEETAEIVGARL